MVGIRVGLRISGEACPVATESERQETGVQEVNKFVRHEGGDVVEEVVFDDEVTSSRESFEEVFSAGDVSIYRFNRPHHTDCACDHIEDCIEHPVSDVRVKNGSLYVTIHVQEIEQLQTLVARLREGYESVSVCKIDHSDYKATEDPMTFDRERLTSRQREVYRTAHEMGYFDHDHETNASDIADELGITVSTFSEHMNTLQDKLADAFFENGEYY